MSERNYWQYGESWYTKYLYLPLTHKEFTFSLHDFPFLLKPILVLNVYSHWTIRYLWLLLYIFIRILVYRWRNWGAQGIRLTDSTLHACSLPAGIVWLHTLQDSVFNVSVIHISNKMFISPPPKYRELRSWISIHHKLDLSVDIEEEKDRENPS